MNNLEQSIKEHFEQASKNADIARAAEKLVKCKGRYHAELNYKALAELFGVTVPTVELESKWIKCSERLPEDGTYLCFKSGNIDVCTIIYGNWIINSFGDTKVTHWMPLPTPPTE